MDRDNRDSVLVPGSPSHIEAYNPSGRTIPAGTPITWTGDVGIATLSDGTTVTLYSSKEAARLAREQ